MHYFREVDRHFLYVTVLVLRVTSINEMATLGFALKVNTFFEINVTSRRGHSYLPVRQPRYKFDWDWKRLLCHRFPSKEGV